MKKKCDKYEGFFVFGTEEMLREHLAICADCREEHEKINKTASIVKEVAPYYTNYRKNTINSNLLKTAAGVVIMSLAFSVLYFNNYLPDTNAKKYNISKVSQNDSVIAEMGLPADDYGLLMVY